MSRVILVILVFVVGCNGRSLDNNEFSRQDWDNVLALARQGGNSSRNQLKNYLRKADYPVRQLARTVLENWSVQNNAFYAPEPIPIRQDLNQIKLPVGNHLLTVHIAIMAWYLPLP